MGINNLIESYKEDFKSLEEKKELIVKLDNCKKEFSRVIKNKRILSEKVDREEKDVKKLSGISLNNALSTIKGNKKERLQKEKLEYLNIKREYDEFMITYNEKSERIDRYEKRIRELRDIEGDFKESKERLVNHIVTLGNVEEYGEIMELNLRFKELATEVCEYDDVIGILEKILNEVKIVLKSLDEADTMGTYDAWFGGGVIVSSMKHSSIDDAKEHVKRINGLVKSFNRELKDLNRIEFNAPKEINFSSSTVMVDMFLDNIFTDFSMLQDIRSGKSKMRKFRDSIYEVFTNINDEREELILKRDGTDIKIILELNNI